MPAKKERIDLICVECGAHFQRLACQLVRPSRGRYCSRACVGHSKRNGSWLQCEMCDTDFYRRFGEQDIGTTVHHFCSVSCYRDWRLARSDSQVYRKLGARHVHRIIAETLLGRSLHPREVVHHIDRDRQNNHPSNLAVFPDQATHVRCHAGKMSDEELRRFSLQ